MLTLFACAKRNFAGIAVVLVAAMLAVSFALPVQAYGLDVERWTAKPNKDGDNTAIIIGSPQQASNIASIALQREIDIPTTISVAQGAPIRVFVARDLDFSGVVQKAR